MNKNFKIILNFKKIIFKLKINQSFFLLSQFLGAIFSLVLGKLIALYISPDQFGLYNLQFAIYTFLFSILLSPTLNYLKSSYSNILPEYGYKPFIVVLSVSSLIMIFILISLFNIFQYQIDLIFSIFLLLVICFNVISNIISDQFNVFGKINLYSIFSILKSLSAVAFFVFMIFAFIHDFNGFDILWIIQFLTGLLSLIFIFKLKKFKSVKKFYLIEFLNDHNKFTIPLVFMALWTWLGNYFDRYIIDSYMGLESVGIYNANYGLGSKFFIVLNPLFLTTLIPLIYKDNNLKCKKITIKNFINIYLILGSFILIILFFSKDIIGEIFLSNTYSDGFYLIFWVALSYFFITASYLYEALFYAEQETRIIMMSYLFSSITNVFLNIIFVPHFGISGAIFSLILSSLVKLLFIYLKFINYENSDYRRN